MSKKAEQHQPIFNEVPRAAAPGECQEIWTLDLSRDGRTYKEVFAFTNGIVFYAVTKEYAIPDDQIGNEHWDLDDETPLVSVTWAPMSFEDVLRVIVDEAPDGAQSLLDELDSIRMGMTFSDYQKHVQAQTKKTKAIARAEAKLAKLKEELA